MFRDSLQEHCTEFAWSASVTPKSYCIFSGKVRSFRVAEVISRPSIFLKLTPQHSYVAK